MYYEKLGISNTKNIDYELFTNLRINVILCFDTRSCYFYMKTSEYVVKKVLMFFLAKKELKTATTSLTTDGSGTRNLIFGYPDPAEKWV